MKLAMIPMLAFLGVTPLTAQAVHVVATTMDLADISKRIGGDAVAVEAIAKGDQDLHRVPPKPTHLIKLKRADVLLEMGLDMEHAWLPALIEQCHNEKIQPGAAGFVNCSAGLKPLEVPKSLDRSLGVDFHPRGNPHFNIDPEGGRVIAGNVLSALAAARPDLAATFRSNHAAFIKELDSRAAKWTADAAGLKGKLFVTRHSSWPYLAERYGFTIVADLEPKAGVEPTPAHVAAVMDLIRKQKVSGIIVPPYLKDGVALRVSEQTGCPLIVLPLGVTGASPNATWLDFMDNVIGTLVRTVGAESRPTGGKAG